MAVERLVMVVVVVVGVVSALLLLVPLGITLAYKCPPLYHHTFHTSKATGRFKSKQEKLSSQRDISKTEVSKTINKLRVKGEITSNYRSNQSEIEKMKLPQVSENIINKPRIKREYVKNNKSNQIAIGEMKLLQVRRNMINRPRVKREDVEKYEEKKVSHPAMSPEALRSLGEMLVRLVEGEVKDCDLVIAHDGASFAGPEVLDRLLRLPRLRQVIQATSEEDLLNLEWVSGKCVAYLMMMMMYTPHPLFTFSNTDFDAWDYKGRYVIIGLSLEDLETLARSEKGRKTEHLVGVIQSGVAGVWLVYQSSHTDGEEESGFLSPVTTWRHHYFTSTNSIFTDQYSDLMGQTLKVVTFAWEPSVFYQRGPEGEVQQRYGVDIQVVQLLARALNFTPSFVEPLPGELWGSKRSDGSWSGMMGLLETGQAAMGVANIYVTISRGDVLDYSTPYNFMQTCLLARTEPPLSRWQALSFPFHWHTWIAFTVGLLLSGPLLFIMTRAMGYSDGDPMQGMRLGSSWLYCYGLHLRETQNKVPRRASTQVLVAFLWVYTIIISIAYCTNLTAFLMVNRPPTAIETIRQLHRSRLKVVGVGSFYQTALAAAVDPYLQDLAKVYESQVNPDAAYHEVLEGRAVFIQNRGFVEFIASTRFSSNKAPKFRIMKECFAPYNIAIGLQRHSLLKTNVDEVIGRINQAGLLRHHFLQSLRIAARSKEYGTGRRDDDEESGDEEKGGVTALNLDHLQGAFIICVLGFVLASITFLVEITFCR